MDSKYHKINSIFKRDPATKHNTFIVGSYSQPEFEYLKNNEWLWSEKIDGTNVRIFFDGSGIEFGGRTDNAQMPVPLFAKLNELFSAEQLGDIFTDAADGSGVYLFGEGYGRKIQKGGGNYIQDGCSFILFDVMVGRFYLGREDVADIACKLGVKSVPHLGSGTLDEAIEYTKGGFNSLVSEVEHRAEGLVIRPLVEMFDRSGKRIIAKVKTRDFIHLQ